MRNRYQIKAFQNQFPAIFMTEERNGESFYKHGAFGVLSDVRVARVTPELMQHKPHREVWPYSSREEKVLLFSRSWELLGSVDQSSSGQVGHTRFCDLGETIGEAISRLECSRDVAFIVSIVEDDPHEGERATSVVLHKSPKSWTIVEWIAREERRAANELCGTLNAIDRVA
jgi:hypothetical protein